MVTSQTKYPIIIWEFVCWDFFPTPLWLLSQWSDSEENLYVKVDAELKWCAAQILGLVQLVGQPSHRHVDAGQDHGDGDLGEEKKYLFIVGVFGIRSLGDVSGSDDVRGVFWFVFPATWSSVTFDCDGCFDFYKLNGGQNVKECRSKETETWFKKCVDLLSDQNRFRRFRIEPEKISRKHQKFNQTP